MDLESVFIGITAGSLVTAVASGAILHNTGREIRVALMVALANIVGAATAWMLWEARDTVFIAHLTSVYWDIKYLFVRSLSSFSSRPSGTLEFSPLLLLQPAFGGVIGTIGGLALGYDLQTSAGAAFVISLTLIILMVISSTFR